MTEGASLWWLRSAAVAIGGAAGAVARYWLSGWLSRASQPSFFPWGTLAVNVLGALAIGLFLGATTVGRFSVSPTVRALVAIGVLGGLTTFSTLAYETIELIQTGSHRQAIANLAFTLGLGLGACWLGLVIGERI